MKGGKIELDLVGDVSPATNIETYLYFIPSKMTDLPTTNLRRAFINGLSDYGLTPEAIKDWKYCGGNTDSHLKYFKLLFPGLGLPEYSNECVCGHAIVKNRYICDANGGDVLIIGSCCIDHFIPKRLRTCSDCGNFHQSRKDNLCLPCRKIREQKPERRCVVCNVVHKSRDDVNMCANCRSRGYHKCTECTSYHTNTWVERCNKCRIGSCDVCDCAIDPKYVRCYFCNKKPKN